MKQVRQLVLGTLAEGSSLGIEIPWEGGPGLLLVGGTFAGTASVSVSATAYSDATIGVGYDLRLAPIAAAGTYQFSGAAGKLFLTATAGAPGDSISALSLTLAELS